MNWMSTKHRSIADSPCGRWSCAVWVREWDNSGKMVSTFSWDIQEIMPCGLASGGDPICGMERSFAEAQAACESWLAAQPPVLEARWHVSDTGLMAQADLNGWAMHAWKWGDGEFHGVAYREDGGIRRSNPEFLPTLPAAQAAIEAEVRRVTHAEPFADTISPETAATLADALKMQPCCDCGNDYPQRDFDLGCLYCEKCRCSDCNGRGQVGFHRYWNQAQCRKCKGAGIASSLSERLSEESRERHAAKADVPKTGSAAANKLILGLRYENAAQQKIIAELREKVACLEDATAGNYWHWQGDGHDFPESLTCRVVMHAEDLRKLLKAVPIGPDGWVTDPNGVVAWKVVDGKTLQSWLMNRWRDDGWGWNVYSRTPASGMAGSLAAAKAAAERAAGITEKAGA